MTQERLRQLLHYNRRTGVFTWLMDRGGHARRGTVAGTVQSDGYVQIRVDRRLYKASRLAWLYVKGVWPAGVVDHKDRNRLNDSFRNLREVTAQANSFNNDAVGAYLRPNGRWQALIGRDGVQTYLGCYDTQAEAHAVYIAAKKKLHPEVFE